MSQITLRHLQQLKKNGEKFSCLTVYDASFARLISSTGVEVMLVGDSLGMVMQGHRTTVPVTVEDAVYHTRCAARGNRGALLMSDLPFMAYATVEQALKNAAAVMQAGAQLVKLEGGAWLAETIQQLSERGIAVCAHVGLTPQSVHKLGGFRVQGRTQKQADQIVNDALALQEAGAQMLVLECVPAMLAQRISEQLTIPTMGIGAGVACDGQVLVLHDMLGVSSGYTLTFCKNFMSGADSIAQAIKNYHDAVKSKSFPDATHEFN